MNQVLQYLVNGLIVGSGYALLGVSFALLFSVTSRFHYAYALTYLVAPVLAVTAVGAGMPLLIAAIIGIAGAGVLGALIEVLVYRVLDKRAGSLSLLGVGIASVALTIAGENVVALLWSPTPTRLLDGFVPQLIKVGAIAFTSLDIITVALCWVLVAGSALVLSRSGLGRNVIAVRSDPAAARLVGISPRTIGLIVIVAASAMSGVLGILAGLKATVSPAMGIEPVFFALVVAFVAGAERSPLLVGFVGLAIGVLQTISQLWLPPVWSSTIVFGILLVYFVGVSFMSRDLLTAQ